MNDAFRILTILIQSVIASNSDDIVLSPTEKLLPHVRLAKDLLNSARYDNRVRPVFNQSQATVVKYSMSLYQILAIDERQQSIDLNVWVIEKWDDEFLGWDPYEYGLINSTVLPYEAIWLPDTYIYNSLVISREETQKPINAVVTTKYWEGKRGAQIMFMYPALYRSTCRMDIRFFPYDQQKCTLVISSWTSSKRHIDYEAEFESVNLDNFIANEEWTLVSFNLHRTEKKFACCPDPWAILEASLVVRRKPLYYIVNLVIPTSLITLVAVTGFFTPASTSNERRQRLSLGIDTLLAMSILMTMVGEQMPVTSEYVPLFGVFYLTIISIIFIGTMFTVFVLSVDMQKSQSRPVPQLLAKLLFHKAAPLLSLDPPKSLLDLWSEAGMKFNKTSRRNIVNCNCSVKAIAKPALREVNRSSSIPWHQSLRSVIELGRDGNTGGEMDSILEEIPSQLPARNEVTRRSWKALAKKVRLGGDESDTYSVNNPRTRLTTISRSTTANRAAEFVTFRMMLRRRYALEWEFLASVLDRILLIFFTFVVLSVTGLIILVGEAICFAYSLD
ncbi:Acetylcholine receptor subunit alpha-type deg-3 [Toxocara canis]|uniref:Acetylcholine receptor subunit alpha-type deg-3 n=1 Tax=Toxocara canis TaxID=6265 RepID=A0A0B2V9F5_TOXCA|nr:Acetylcholine receptor subunit alpha-type deg-3 [Toxocara canis]